MLEMLATGVEQLNGMLSCQDQVLVLIRRPQLANFWTEYVWFPHGITHQQNYHDKLFYHSFTAVV